MRLKPKNHETFQLNIQVHFNVVTRQSEMFCGEINDVSEVLRYGVKTLTIKFKFFDVTYNH